VKSFEEAITVAIGPTESDFRRYGSLYTSVCEDATRSAKFRFMSNSIIREVGANGMRPDDAIMTAFVNGVIVGCEMEKHETGGIDLASLPDLKAPSGGQEGAADVRLDPPVDQVLPLINIGEGQQGQKESRQIGFNFYLSKGHTFLLIDGLECSLGVEEVLTVGTRVHKVALPVEANHLQALMNEIREAAAERGWEVR
jgi:hypothetical protein